MSRVLSNGNVIRFLVLLVLIVFFGILSNGASITLTNLENVIVQSAIRGIAACGQALVVMSAGIDLAVSGIVALVLMVGGGLVTANETLNLIGFQMPSVFAILIMLLMGGAFGLFSGVLVAWIRIPALLATLGVWQISEGLAFRSTGTGFVDGIPQNIIAINQFTIMSVPMPIIILTTVALLSYFVLERTVFGREIYAVGGNARAAALSGVRVARIRIAVFSVAGVLYGISAVLSMSRFQGATLAQASGLELETLAAVAIGGVSLSGGKGTILGVILGVLIVGVIGNGLNILGAGPTAQNLVKGGLLVFVVVLDTDRARDLIRRVFQRRVTA